MKEIKKKIFIAILALLVCCLIWRILSNNLSAEETVNKFMYLVHERKFEQAKKLCKEELENINLLTNINPDKLIFNVSDNQEKATAIIQENKETAEVANLNIILQKTFWGWKIKDYNITKDYIPQEIVQRRLESHVEVSDGQFWVWAISDKTKPDDISKYAEDNDTILALFSNFMSKKKYEKAFGLYKEMNVKAGKELTEKEIKEFDWNNYIIEQNIQIVGTNVFILKDKNKTIKVMIGADRIISHIYTDNN